MFKVTKTQTRPNTAVNFMNPADPGVLTELAVGHYYNNYMANGKVISNTSTVSPDGLTLTTVTVWDSENSWSQFMNDEVIKVNILDVMKNYNTDNNIETTYLNEQV